jgi:hypothetical protein
VKPAVLSYRRLLLAAGPVIASPASNSTVKSATVNYTFCVGAKVFPQEIKAERNNKQAK